MANSDSVRAPSQNNDLNQLKDYFDLQFAALKRDFKRDTEWIEDSVSKKVKRVHTLNLKKASNRIQFEFNSSILDTVASIEKAIKLREADKALDFVKELKVSIEHRNKLIRIADSSEAGWGTIAEYENLDVADNSDDDRRIRRAEERAKKKAEIKSASSASFNSDTKFRGSTGMRGRGRGFYGRAFDRQVVCFHCGQVGHFSRGCARAGGYGAIGAGQGSVAATASSDDITTGTKQEQQ